MTDKMIIRPSSVDNFYQCSHQWYRTFIRGESSKTNSRAAIGTAIHAGVEQMWTESIEAKDYRYNQSASVDKALEAFKEEEKKGMQYDSGETNGTCSKEIMQGIDTFVEDVVPWTSIPTAVEQRYTVAIDGHEMVGGISGTVDYIHTGLGIISDVKTSKRKPTPANYTTQQSIYKYLAEENGIKVNTNTIQAVVLKKVPEGHILEMPTNVPQAKALVNNLLDTLDVYMEDIMSPDVLFRGNPKYYLCSAKYCAFHSTCKYTNGS
jgi:hypothetical protein